MSAFLEDVARQITNRFPKPEEPTLVFPNRRGILFFREHYARLLQKPALAPRMVTIEDFIGEHSPLQVPDKLQLVRTLYTCYSEVTGSDEPFDAFYFWGEMLLRDFEELDKYLVPANLLFADLSQLKELDSSFDYLTDEQKEFLTAFWSSFTDPVSKSKAAFVSVWKNLFPVYTTFRERLMEAGQAYGGMVQRAVAESIEMVGNQQIVFIGFNALTRAEEKIISWFVDNREATVFWDLDEYYVNSDWQEAGRFFREYQRHASLGKTFPSQVPSHFRSAKSVRVFGAPQPTGQAKWMADLLAQEMANGMKAEETLVVLPDEKLLLPVLHGVAGSTEKLNVTMGFPLSQTPMFTFVELLIELQLTRRADLFNHRVVLALLGHAYGNAPDPGQVQTKRKEILEKNWIYVPGGFLSSGNDLHRIIFREASLANLLPYLRESVTCLGNLEGLSDLDREYAYHLVALLNRISDVVGNSLSSYRSFLSLFRQLVQSTKIPFTGEPLAGLQIMGMLETRTLDFKNVFLLSLNEGSLPPFGQQGSFIPYSVRKAYKLPTPDHQDAMYAYLFYRVLQRAENIFLFYNTETDVLGQGEASRLLKQLQYESGLPVQQQVLHHSLAPLAVKPIVLEKRGKVLEELHQVNETRWRINGLTPSVMNTYLECRLQFYLKHVARIREADTIEEDLDARLLGIFLHNVMEAFYKRVLSSKKSNRIERSDFEEHATVLDQLLQHEFTQQYSLDPEKPVEYDGQRLLVKEIVKEFAQRILKADKAYAPFTMEGLELENLRYTVELSAGKPTVVVGGKIDRVDRKENIVRVVDYKTGKDKVEFDSLAALFTRDGKRNKAAFQTLVYTLLFDKSRATGNGERVVPGLISRVNLFDEQTRFGFRMSRSVIDDARPLLPEFEARLNELLEEMFDPSVPIDQTQHTDTCAFCAFKAMCYR